MDDKTRNIGLTVVIILIIAIVGYTVFQPSIDLTLSMSNGSTNLSDNSNITQKNNSTANAQGKICPVCNSSGKELCALCNGTGKDGNSVCQACNGVGKFPCDACGGDGYINAKDKGYSG